MTIHQTAFIDLENALVAKTKKAVAKETNQLVSTVNDLIRVGALADAYKTVENFDLTPAMDNVRLYMHTILRASFFLGVSRLTNPRNSPLFKNMPTNQIDRMVELFEKGVMNNVLISIIARGSQAIAEIESSVLENQLGTGIEKRPLEVQGAGLDGIGIDIPSDDKYYGYTFNPMKAEFPSVSDPFLTAGSSLVISRANTFGFIEQALIDGVTEYRINEILDSKICPVCRVMNGKTFDVQLAAQAALSIMSTTDPDELKFLAPWPDQTKAGVERLEGMSQKELENAGYLMPPFHPRCRGYLEAYKSLPKPTLDVEPDTRPELSVVGSFGRGVAEGALLGGLLGIGKEDIAKFNPYHDELGRFTTADGSVLPMDHESRMARAREMGFDTETVWYHGTRSDVKEFSDEHSNEFGIHFGSPEAANARLDQTKLETEMGFRSDFHDKNQGNITPVYLRANKPLRMTESGMMLRGGWKPVDLQIKLRNEVFDGNPPAWLSEAEVFDLESEGYITKIMDAKDGYSLDISEQKDNTIKWLESKGFDSIVYGNQYEGGGDSIIVFRPEQIRSVNAVFNPEDATEGNILKFNPYHDELGRFTTADEAVFTSAADWARRYDDPHATPDSILNDFNDPELKDKMQAKRDELDAMPTTISQFRDEDGVWDEERVRTIHNPIIKSFLPPDVIAAAQVGEGETPEYITLGGRPASGKSFFTMPASIGGRDLNANGDYFVFHSDKVLESLPGYEGWNASLYHEEAKHVANQVIGAARRNRMNLIVEGTMKNSKKIARNAQVFKDAGYDISGFYMHLPRQESALRTVTRFVSQGRYVPIEVVLSNKANEEVFDSMRDVYKRWEIYDNMNSVWDPKKNGYKKPPQTAGT